MTAAEKKQMIENYATDYIREYDRGDNFAALYAKFECCITYYLCEKTQFDRVVTRLRQQVASN